MAMVHPRIMVLGGDEFRTPELELAMQRKGWNPLWVDSSDHDAVRREGPDVCALVVDSGQGDSSIQSIRDIRSNNPMIPLVLIGGNSAVFPMAVDAMIPRGASPDVWLTTLKPYCPTAPSQSGAQAAGGEVFGKYRLLRKIASGGMAEIFMAEQLDPPGFNRVLAIKKILPKHSRNPVFTEMMLDEANLGARLSHQGIARVFDMGIESGSCYIAMEYVDGGNLRCLIDNAVKLGIVFPEPIAAFIILQAAEALDHAHRTRGDDGQALGLVHRDVSPQNILVSREGAVKVIDFGIAKAAGLSSGHAPSPALRGKLHYMSPEQSMGAQIDQRSDVFSLGLVLYELLTSQRCFHSESESGLLETIRSGAVRDVKTIKPDTSKPMARIIDKALQKNLSSRYSSAHVLALDLKVYLDHLNFHSLEQDTMAFVKLLLASQPQAKAFAASRFAPVKGDIVLYSERRRAAMREGVRERAATRPNWVLPVVNVLLVLLAWLLWVSINL